MFFITIELLVAQSESGILRGFVKDSTNGEALAFSNVLLLETGSGTATDQNGYFILTGIQPNKKYTLIASYIGYLKKQTTIAILPNKTTFIEMFLSPVGVQLNEIEKVGEYTPKQRQLDISVNRLQMKDLEYLPQGVEKDIMRSLRSIAGVQSTGDVSARYYVRGGTSNQNLVLLNDAPIYNPFHAFGLFSVVDPEIVNNIEFYKGGFPTQYSGRISSVLKIISKDGNKNNFSGSVSISQLAAKVLVEGPIPHGSFLLTGRKSISTNVLRKFLSDKKAPIDFHDESFKITYSNPDFMPTSKFTFYGFLSGDFLNNGDPLLEDFNWKNNLLGFKWFQAGDSPLFLEVGVYVSTFSGEVIPNFSKVNQKENTLNDITLKMDFTYVFDSNDELTSGLNVSNIKTVLRLKNQFNASTEIENYGSDIAFYTKYKVLQFNKFAADFGSRINLASLIPGDKKKYTFEPRINLSYKLFENLTLKSAWGIYQQELTTLSDETEIISLFEPWVIAPKSIGPSKGVHYIGGIEYNLTDKTTLQLEGFYKFVRGYPTLNANKFESSDPDLLPGSMESSGIEFQINSSFDNFNISSAYSFSRAYKEVNGWIYYPRYDSRHNFNVNLSYNFFNDWTVSIYWTFNSALPFTQARGYYDKLFFNDLYNSYPVYESYKPYSVLDDINLGRLTNYHRMDFSIKKKFKTKLFEAEGDISILNVYNRKNLFYFKRDIGESVYMLPFLFTATLQITL